MCVCVCVFCDVCLLISYLYYDSTEQFIFNISSYRNDVLKSHRDLIVVQPI